MNLSKFIRCCLVCFAVTLAVSCNKTLGYSVVLWGTEENQLNDCDIVKVFVKSNITHTYIIENPDTKEHAEIPIWQISTPEKKKNAEVRANRYKEYAKTFASVKLDGLPIRAEAVNTSKQVYKLREKEIIRILYKSEGSAVSNGKTKFEGDWYKVMTSEGTQGFCFSYNLDIYKSDNGGKRDENELASNEVSEDKNIQILRTKKWLPSEYADLIRAKRIDLTKMNENFGFTFDETTGKIEILTANENKTFNFKELKKFSGRQYQFDGSNVLVTVKNDREISVQYMENGKPRIANFSEIKEDIAELIKKEIKRRDNELYKIQHFGPKFVSNDYGTLTILGSDSNYSFTWNKFNRLAASGVNIVDKEATGSGSISIKYFLSDSLKSNYHGILTFNFNGAKNESNFFYQIVESGDGTGIRLIDAKTANIKDNVVTTKGTPQITIFLSNDKK